MAERLGTGLQNLLQRFDSASHLSRCPRTYSRGIFCFDMKSASRTVRAARYDDIPRILEILDAARIRMCQSGNPTQWQPGYPTAEMVSRDIDRNAGYIIEDDGVEVAYFACLPSPDPTYDIIYEGNWLDDTLPYCVIHRIGGIPSASGIFESIMDYCFSRCSNIRIDTHRDNHVMLHLIQKRGFTYCGIIHLANGDERLAYQKLD